MPGFITLFRGLDLPIIDCRIAFPLSVASPVAHPAIDVRALVDTGASHCVITPHVLSQIPLPFLREMDNTVVGGAVLKMPAHLCDVTFVGKQYADPNIEFTLNVRGATVLVDNLVGWDMLLGWDVLASVDMSFNRDSTVSIHLPT